MVLSRVSIERPVFATVVSLLLIVLGVGALLRLPVREYPDVDPPTVSVSTVYPGASAAVVEREVTERIEDVVSSIEGIDVVTSTSRDGLSTIDIEFALDRDLDAAAADVRDKLGQVRAELPEEAEEPVISKTAGDSQAMMWLTLTSDERDRLELTDYAERNLVDPLSVVPGVARVIVGGERRYAMRVFLDVEAMAARGVTVDDVTERLRRQNLELPAGRIESQDRELTVRTATRLLSAEAFRDLIVYDAGNYQVTLGDVARVEVGAEQDRSAVRRGGEPAIGLGVIRQSKSNTLEVADGVLAEVERLRSSIPDDVDIEVSYNEAVFIEGSIQQVIKTLAITGALVVAVIFLFLRSFRTLLIPAATIPVSLVATFIVLAAFGYSVNTLTLLALVLAVGLVVDDSIVVLENIYRRNEDGEPRLLAASRGADQIGFAVIATTLVLIAVFVPLAFLSGDVGRLFTEFGVALAASVAFSSLVALTLGPMLASKLVDARSQGGGRFYRATQRGFEALDRGYRRAVAGALGVPWLVVAVGLAVSAAATFLYRELPQELAPVEDRGAFIVPVEAPEGATLDYTRRHVERIEGLINAYAREDGPVDTTISIVGTGDQGPPEVNSAFIIVKLKPWGERERSQQAVVGELSPKLAAIPGVRAFAVNPPSLGQGGFDQPVQFVVGGPEYDTAYRWAEEVLAGAREVPGLRNARLDYEETKPQVRLTINRAKAADLGLDVRQIGEALQVLFGSLDVTDYTARGETYEVVLEAEAEDKDTPKDLADVYLRSTTGGELIKLGNVVDLEEVGAPVELKRVDRLPSVTLTGSLAEGAALGDVLGELERIAAERLPEEGARISYLGRSQEYQESSAGIYVTFALALLIVFLVLAAQFESFVHPATIMTAVPLAITGGLLALRLTGLSFNIFSQIGLILLIGLMAKNGILIVEFANQLRDRGQDIRDAVLEAAKTRLRPILMTSVATIAGAFPLALASGPGAEGRTAIGVVIIGGMTLATVLTLFVVPALYLLLARLTKPSGVVARRLRELEREEADAGDAPRRLKAAE